MKNVLCMKCKVFIKKVEGKGIGWGGCKDCSEISDEKNIEKLMGFDQEKQEKIEREMRKYLWELKFK